MAGRRASGALKLRVPGPVAALISHLHPKLKAKVRAALEHLTHDPFAGKGLQGELAGLWSFRVGSFRIVYRVAAGQQLEIVSLGPRDRIYEETYRLVRAKPGR